MQGLVLRRFFVILFVVLGLSACGTSQKKAESSAEQGSSGEELSGGDASAHAYADGSSVTSHAATGTQIDVSKKTKREKEMLATTVIYFDFDKSGIREDYYDILLAHARYITSNPNIKVRLSGHADERGTREYNLALGERRAKSVAEVLTLNGVNDGQIEVISYGEEAPASLGHDEASWEKNRRVEIAY